LNPALTTALFSPGNSIENNALAAPDGVTEGLSDDMFTGEFSAALKDILAADGKLKPLDIATLKEFGIQQLTDLEELSGIQLPSQSLSDAIKLLQKQTLDTSSIPIDVSESTDALNIVGNPNAISLLKSDVIDDNFSESVLSNQTDKSGLFSKREITEVIQQLPQKKESGMPFISNDSDTDFSKFVKEMSLKDVDFKNDVLMQTNRQETNTLKLVDHLASIDKTTNVINPVNNNSLKTYSSSDQPGTMLNRIEVPVTQAGWGEAVSNRLMMMVNGKMQSANIQLNPAELGPIEIRVNVSQENASVHFVSSNSIVRDAIEEAFPRLKEMFMQNGLTLNDANVSQHSSSQHGNAYSNEENNPNSLAENNDVDNVDRDESQLDNDNNDSTLPLSMVDHYV
jgi:flagellar hook-length control protein FliK